MDEHVLELSQVQKAYGALRPLRMRDLRVPHGGVVALLGLDAPAAEIFVNLVTTALVFMAGLLS